MFGAIAGGIASALAGGAMSKLFGGGQKAASGGIQGDVLATDNNTVGMGDAGITFLKASHSFRNRLLVICKNAYLFATMIMTSVSSPFSCCSGIVRLNLM